MKVLLLTLLLVGKCLAKPTIEDNKLPTDQEVLGQPEEVASLGLPSDEESFNHLSVFFNPSKPSAPVGSGTYHFVSSTFPEVDARGFHESVFDGIGDYFPSWPAPYKRGYDYPPATTLAQRLGLQPRIKFSKRSDSWAERSLMRNKRMVYSKNTSQELDSKEINTVDGSPTCNHCYNTETKILKKRETVGEPQNSIEHGTYSDNKYYNLPKRTGQRYVRGMEMGSFGFHGDVFNGDFGDFTTMRKRARGSMGFHGDTFSDGFGDFATMKRSQNEQELLLKLKDYFHVLSDGNYNALSRFKSNDEERQHLFNQVKAYRNSNKRKPDLTPFGIYADKLSQANTNQEPTKKGRPGDGSLGFHGDTFSQGFGDFSTVKKRRPMGSSGFHGDTFSQGFGDFDTYKKRRPMGAMGFHGDTFSQGFGDFDTYKKRSPKAKSMKYNGDTSGTGFGAFGTLDKRRPMGSSGFHGDTFSQGFGDFDTYKKRRPEMDSMGFHGDTFSRGFGEFEPFKKRRPMGSMGFHGDTFSQGFGDFDTVKKRSGEINDGSVVLGNRGIDEFDSWDESERVGEKKCCSDSSIQRHQEEH